MGRYAGNAERLFKVVQCIRGDWKTRLVSMYKEGLFDLAAEHDVDYTELLKVPYFAVSVGTLTLVEPNLTSALTIALTRLPFVYYSNRWHASTRELLTACRGSSSQALCSVRQ